ncbi:peptide chain release factor N(5)-glutamine methyltransferase [Candidatus Saccharibacteria bacterium]|nr:peptide chain release factor N(5)-glutamine methyltransferase [Candidatus Saccharibacteria bacterium]
MDDTTEKWLNSATAILAGAGIESARLDAVLLLCDELGVDKSALFAYPERELQRSQLQNLNKKIIQRTHHIPLAYLRGRVEFYGRKFGVNHHVLVPRPESESIIELCKQVVGDSQGAAIVDVGTGSGCLAITAKLELPHTTVHAIDLDTNCLSVARANAQFLHASITLLDGNLLEPLKDSQFTAHSLIVLANLPYVPLDHPINTAAAHEPKLALFSGHDGLDHYRALFAQIYMFALYPDRVITESLVSQHIPLAKLAAKHGYVLETTDGLAQLYRHNTIK